MARTLWDALGEVPDGRGRKGRQIPLQAILAVSVAAMLAGADSLIAIFRYGRRLRPEALKILGFPNASAPCHASYHYVFLSIDGDALSRVLGKFALGDAAPGHMAIDGKTLRGSRRLDAKALLVLSAFSTGLSAVVGDLVVEPDQNEITAALILLKSLPLDGAILTGDAIFCQRQICQQIRDAKAHYLFSVKKNHPELHDAIAESFGDLSPLGTAERAPQKTPHPSFLTPSPSPKRSTKAMVASKPARHPSAPKWCRISAGVHAKHGSAMTCSAGHACRACA